MRQRYSFFSRLSLCLLFGYLGTTMGLAQDLSALDEGPDFKISGGLNVNQVFYATSNETKRRDPYNYFLGGNVSISAYGLSIPLSFSYSNQDFSFSQPFNQYGLQPTYKWVKGYFGYNSLNFSKYTLAGHIFNGVGLELTPESVPISATLMYGRLRKAVPVASEEENAQPSFRRMGYGIKLAYTPNGDRYEMSLFGAWDDLESLSIGPADTLAGVPKPQQNVALGLKVNKQVGKILSLDLEYGNSSLTRDVLTPTVQNEIAGRVRQPVALLDALNPRRSGTAYYQAIKGGLNANLSVVTLGVGYERIDPGYATLGAYFFNGDLENLTTNVSTNLFKNRLNVALNVGGQRNNLDADQVSSTARWVGSINVSGQISDRLNVNANYSNFQTFARVQTQDQFNYVNSLSEYDTDRLDTLTFVQVNQSGALSASYVLSTNQDQPMALVANATYSTSSDSNPQSVAGATFYNLSTAYSYKNQPLELGLTVAANATVTVQDTLRTTQFGPTVSANQSLLDKTLKLTASVSANRSLSNALGASGWISNLRLAANYQLGERHQFRLNSTLLGRPIRGEDGGRQNEFTANLGYSFSF